ncbi:MAG: type III pantothenate kinase [Sedimenticola sp.]|nr:type III pantothenate kinase [Sedimenticola sp.]
MGNAASTRCLLVDIGNSNLKWALYEQGELSVTRSHPHRSISASSLAEQCWGGITQPDAIYLASVAEATLGRQLGDWMKTRWGHSPFLVRSEACALGVTNGYDDPAQLGVDRWLTLLAVHAIEQRSACIVDCGTALTIDLLDMNGQHHGGMILPGLHLMREALLARTHIPRVEGVPADTLFSRNTATAVASAAINAAAGLIERSLREAALLCGETARLILTGSDARVIAAIIEQPCEIDSDLVMKGLVAIARSRAHS